MFEWIFGTEQVCADEKQKKLRHILHQQIRKSKIRLLPTKPIKLVRQNAITPFNISRKKKFKPLNVLK